MRNVIFFTATCIFTATAVQGTPVNFDSVISEAIFANNKNNTFQGMETLCKQDMNNLLSIAKSDSRGKRPDGRCYSHVADFIDASGYGGIAKNGFDAAIPSSYWSEAHQFADYLNKDGNAARLHLTNLGLDNPYNAPAGAIVVVRAGTPGTANPTAGDIAVADGASGNFWNGGDMGYGGSKNFPPGNSYVLGIYAPTKCSGSGPSPGPSPGPSDSCSDCRNCVSNGGGRGCDSRCQSCGSGCISCINGGGGKACASRCSPSSGDNDAITKIISKELGRGFLRPQARRKVDCVGAWGYCGKKCLETFKISTPASGGGKPCSARNGDKRRCTGGNCKNPSPGPSPGPAPGPGDLHNIFNGAEVKQCYGLISKDPQLVRVENRIFVVTNCRRGGPVGSGDFLQSNYTALAAGRRRLDPTSKSVTIIKSSDDEGKTWGDFRVLSQNGWSGGYYYGAKGIYDQKRKRFIIQWTDNSHGASVKLWQVTSDDQGKTFSKVRDMTHILGRCAPNGQPRSGNTAGNRIQLPLQQYPNGRVLFGTGAAFVPHSGSSSWMCLWYSEDGGETYNTTKPLKPSVGEFSMVVADTRNGRLLVNGRQNMGHKTKSRQNYWSSDGGLSWDGPHDSGLKGAVSDNGSGCEASITNVNNVLYFFNPSGGGPGDHPSRTNMQVQCSKDNGKSWKSSYKVTTTTEGGYSDIMGVSGGKLLLVWGIGDSNAKNPKRNMYAQTIDTNWCK